MKVDARRREELSVMMIVVFRALSFSCLESENLSYVCTPWQTVHTPWQRGLLLTDSAKGIRADYMFVMHIGKRWRSPFSHVL